MGNKNNHLSPCISIETGQRNMEVDNKYKWMQDTQTADIQTDVDNKREQLSHLETRHSIEIYCFEFQTRIKKNKNKNTGRNSILFYSSRTRARDTPFSKANIFRFGSKRPRESLETKKRKRKRNASLTFRTKRPFGYFGTLDSASEKAWVCRCTGMHKRNGMRQTRLKKQIGFHACGESGGGVNLSLRFALDGGSDFNFQFSCQP